MICIAFSMRKAMAWRPASKQSMSPRVGLRHGSTASASALAAPPPLVASGLLGGRRHTHAVVTRSASSAEWRKQANKLAHVGNDSLHVVGHAHERQRE